jgi:hypothetical protein
MKSVLENAGHDNELLVRYLLGSLSAEQAEPFDERSVTEDAFVARLDAIERDLIDAYVRQELSGDDLMRFRSHYLSSPIRLQRVAFAQALLQSDFAHAVSAVPSANSGASTDRPALRAPAARWSWLTFPRFLSLGFAASAIALLIAVTYLSLENARLHRGINDSQQRETALTRDLDEQRAAAERGRAQSQAQAQTSLDQLKIVALLLPPPTRGVVRLPSIEVPSGADLAVLSLGLDLADYKIYRAVLKDPATERTVWSSGDLARGENKVVSLSFSSRLLRSQTYVVELSGVRAGRAPELVGSYAFRAKIG